MHSVISYNLKQTEAKQELWKNVQSAFLHVCIVHTMYSIYSKHFPQLVIDMNACVHVWTSWVVSMMNVAQWQPDAKQTLQLSPHDRHNRWRHTKLIHTQFCSEMLAWQQQGQCGCNGTRLVYKLYVRQL